MWNVQHVCRYASYINVSVLAAAGACLLFGGQDVLISYTKYVVLSMNVQIWSVFLIASWGVLETLLLSMWRCFFLKIISMKSDSFKAFNPKTILLNSQKLSDQLDTHEKCFKFTHQNAILVNLAYRNRIKKYRSYFCAYIRQKLKRKIKAEMKKKKPHIVLLLFFRGASGEHLTFRHLHSEIYFRWNVCRGVPAVALWCGDLRLHLV